MIKVSDYIARFLYEHTKSRHVFMLSGGMAMHLIESFGNHTGFKIIPTHHEAAAGIAANAYGRILGTAGICLVTAGPGALNAVTPCAGAYLESNPLFFISGQVSLKNGIGNLPLRQRGIQEIAIVPVVSSITKYAVHVSDPRTIRFHLEKAHFLANAGRPGPVWLDIPVDVQDMQVDEEALPGFSPSSEELACQGDPVSDTLARDILGRITRAKRPMLILGQGVRLAGASGLAIKLVERLGIPVQTTWNGMDMVPADHPLSFGRANVFGPRYANLLVQNADLLLVLGARLGMQHTGYNVEAFGRGAEIIMVDLDPTEMEKPGLNVGTRLRADAGQVIERLLAVSEAGQSPAKHDEWLEFCRNIRDKYQRKIDPDAGDYVDPFHLVARLSRLLPSDAVIPYGSSGMGHTVFGGNFEPKGSQRVFCFKGLASMGYGLPCTVGAALASPGKLVFTVVGEGGLQLNLQELQTIRHFGLPVKIIVFNNGGYHSIHMTQTSFFAGHFVASGPESDVTFPELSKVAACYGLKYDSVRNNADVDRAIETLCASPEPGFLEVFIDPTKPLEPKLASYKLPDGTMESRPLEDMVPLLPREELAGVMHIPLVS